MASARWPNVSANTSPAINFGEELKSMSITSGFVSLGNSCPQMVVPGSPLAPTSRNWHRTAVCGE